MRSFQLFDAAGNEVFLDPTKLYKKDEFGSIVEITEESKISDKELLLASSQSDVRLGSVNHSNLIKVDNKISTTKATLLNRKRKSVFITSNLLEFDEFQNFVLDIGSSILVTKLEVSDPATVEIFSKSDMSDEIPYKFISTEDHLIDDGRMLMTDNSIMYSKRTFTLFNNDDPVKNKIYCRLTNSELVGALAISLTIEYIPIETVDITNNLVVDIIHNITNPASPKFSGLMITPTNTLLGSSGDVFISDFEELYNTSLLYISRRRPDKIWPIDEDGGWWTSTTTLDSIDTKFNWPRTPTDGTYFVYIPQIQANLSNVSPIDISVNIKLGESEHLIPLQLVPLETAPQLSRSYITFTIADGKFIINPTVKLRD